MSSTVSKATADCVTDGNSLIEYLDGEYSEEAEPITALIERVTVLDNEVQSLIRFVARLGMDSVEQVGQSQAILDD